MPRSLTTLSLAALASACGGPAHTEVDVHVAIQRREATVVAITPSAPGPTRGERRVAPGVRAVAPTAPRTVAASDLPCGDDGAAPPGIAQIALGPQRTCTRHADGRLCCWGARPGVQGHAMEASERVERPSRVAGIDQVVSVGLGAAHTCALLHDGTVSCWGRNTYGELGVGGTEPRRAPTRVEGLANVDLLGVGHWSTCARVRDDGVRCWGGGSAPGRAMQSVPTRVEGVDDAADFALGVDRCVITRTRAMHCWGDALMYTYRHADRVGDRFRHYTLHALRDLRALGLAWSEYAAGDQYACALDGHGALWCWGGGYRGDHDRETGASSDRMVPVNVGGIRDATALAVAGDHACVIRDGAKLWCWGANDAGQIGDGTRVSRTLPVEISAHLAVVAVAVAEGHTCAQTRDGALWCWGDNRSGQLGDGTTEARLVPTAVRWRAL